jgi:hypothetical protein
MIVRSRVRILPLTLAEKTAKNFEQSNKVQTISKNFIKLVVPDGTVVEHSAPDCKIKGSNSVTCTRRENAKKIEQCMKSSNSFSEFKQVDCTPLVQWYNIQLMI